MGSRLIRLPVKTDGRKLFYKMDGSNALRRRYDDEDANEFMLWFNRLLWINKTHGEPLDIKRYELSRLAPDPVTGTPYPFTGKLESTWSGPTGIEFYKYYYGMVVKDRLFSRAEDAARRLQTFWNDPLKIVSTSRITKIQDAERRLEELPKLQEGGNWGPDIIFKAFHDLDLALFGGTLHRKCKLRWRTNKEWEREPGPNAAKSIGFCRQEYLPYKDIAIPGEDDAFDDCWCWTGTIFMNSTIIFLYPVVEHDGVTDGSRWKTMWGVLVHEMVHAYVQLSVKPGRIFEPHGVEFQRCLRTVNRRLGNQGLNLGFNGTLATEWDVDEEGNLL